MLKKETNFLKQCKFVQRLVYIKWNWCVVLIVKFEFKTMISYIEYLKNETE